ncbi:MAG: hypothetical protein R3C24_12310 [Cyanobacteriota/Melainabacteria group bacterium]
MPGVSYHVAKLIPPTIPFAVQRLSHVSRLQDSYLCRRRTTPKAAAKKGTLIKTIPIYSGELLVEFGLITDDLLEQA